MKPTLDKESEEIIRRTTMSDVLEQIHGQMKEEGRGVGEKSEGLARLFVGKLMKELVGRVKAVRVEGVVEKVLRDVV